MNNQIIARSADSGNDKSKKARGKKRGAYYKPSIKDFDSKVYWELQIEDDRNALTLAIALGKKSKIARHRIIQTIRSGQDHKT